MFKAKRSKTFIETGSYGSRKDTLTINLLDKGFVEFRSSISQGPYLLLSKQKAQTLAKYLNGISK